MSVRAGGNDVTSEAIYYDKREGRSYSPEGRSPSLFSPPSEVSIGAGRVILGAGYPPLSAQNLGEGVDCFLRVSGLPARARFFRELSLQKLACCNQFLSHTRE